jgi:hypothetical protein
MERNIDEYVDHVVRDCMGDKQSNYDVAPKNQAEQHLFHGIQHAITELKEFLKSQSDYKIKRGTNSQE